MFHSTLTSKNTERILFRASQHEETLRWEVPFVRLTILFYLNVFVQQKRRAKRLSICQLLKCTARSLRGNSRKESGQESMSSVAHVSRGKHTIFCLSVLPVFWMLFSHILGSSLAFHSQKHEARRFFEKEN